MKISVIIPVFNAESSITATVKSLSVQEFAGLEVILVDDGSTDASGAICDSLAVLYDNVKVLHKDNGGVSSARNMGLDVAEGEYVMFLDADDSLAEGALESLYAPDYDMVIAGFEKIRDNESLESHKPPFSKIYKGHDQMTAFWDDLVSEKDSYLLNSSCFKLFRRSVIEARSLRFDTMLRYGEDKMFVFSFLRFADKVRTVSEVVYKYMIQGESLSSDLNSDNHISQILTLLDRYTPVLDELRRMFPDSRRIGALYHVDVVSRYVFRILTCFALRKSRMMTYENIALLYSYMSEDSMLGVSSIRPMQLPNYLLFRIGNVRLTMAFYKFTSSISAYMRLR